MVSWSRGRGVASSSNAKHLEAWTQALGGGHARQGLGDLPGSSGARSGWFLAGFSDAARNRKVDPERFLSGFPPQSHFWISPAQRGIKPNDDGWRAWPVRNLSRTRQEPVKNLPGTHLEPVKNPPGTCQEPTRNLSRTYQEPAELSEQQLGGDQRLFEKSG